MQTQIRNTAKEEQEARLNYKMLNPCPLALIIKQPIAACCYHWIWRLMSRITGRVQCFAFSTAAKACEESVTISTHRSPAFDKKGSMKTTA